VTVGQRYAIYFSPRADDRLWEFGSSVVGYDAVTGAAPDQPGLSCISAEDFHARTEDPRQYGFHATLKPPFHPVDGETIDRLLAAAGEFAALRRAFDVGALDVTAISGFLALVPTAPSAELTALADDCVRAFDRFRAPLVPADRERRLKSPLTARQIAYLDQWGYPYVFEEFRFHMTLTGRLHHDEREEVKQALSQLYRPVAAPFVVDGISVFEQAMRGERFTLLQRLAFGA
jgi:putative phosphonate metabolism protein